jgi:hypothetical protein
MTYDEMIAAIRANEPPPPPPPATCGWPPMPNLPSLAGAYARGAADPAPIPERVNKYYQAQNDLAQAGWGAWGLHGKKS